MATISSPGLVIGWTLDPLEIQCEGGMVRVAVSTRPVGDFNPDRLEAVTLEQQRRAALDLAWSMPAEHHGVEVFEVTEPGAHDGASADGLVTGIHGAALGIWTGDCAAVAIIAPDGRFGVAHVGWRGLAEGMLTSIINSLVMIDSMGSPPEQSTLMAVVGPLIGPCCYEFSRQEAERVARGAGASIEQVWFRGARGVFVLDMRAAIRIALTTAGLDPGSIAFDARCTGCDPTLFSYRMGKDIERQVLVVWKTPDE